MQRRVTDFYTSSATSSDLAYVGGLTRLNVSNSAQCDGSLLSPINGRKRKARASTSVKMKQLILDAGQSKIGLQHCAKCGMVYNIDDKKDVESHEFFHNRFSHTKFFRVTVGQLETWKGNLYWEYTSTPINGMIFRVSATSAATLRKRVEDLVNTAVNEQTGYCSDLPVWDLARKRQAIVFIATATENEPPFVGALLLIDVVPTATLMPEKKNFKGHFIGVNRIWTHSRLRQLGLATMLLDAACRFAVLKGQTPLPRTRIAFVDPTEAGIQLAKRYVGKAGGDRYIVHSPN